MPRLYSTELLRNHRTLGEFGLTIAMVREAVEYVHETLDTIDAKLTEGGGEPLARLLELANLSAIVGNLFRGGVVRAAKGGFAANMPHRYPDMLGRGLGCCDLEIKVALEDNLGQRAST